MQPNPQENPAPITVLYDSKCPLCCFGVEHYQPDEESGELEIVDMRQDSAFKNEALAHGFDLDKGVVVKSGGTLFYGDEAMRFMAIRSNRKHFLGRMLHLIFRSPARSRLIYPFLSGTRRGLLWLRNLPTVQEESCTRKESTIKKQLGNAWGQLHPQVQKRFATDPSLNEHVFYRGTMEVIECSRAGKLFAHLTRFIANPLTPYEGKNVQMDVLLHRKIGHEGFYWRRTYYYPGRTPYTVTSVKRQDSKGHMTECVGGGFGMALQVSAKNGALHFESTRYFWQAGKLRIPLPHWLTPGTTHVIHEDTGNGTFRFTISMHHPFLGRTFYQTGIFQEV